MRSPGVPRSIWLAKRLASLAMFVIGSALVIRGAKFKIKPWRCRQSDSGDCVDPRAASVQDLSDTLLEDWIYWGIRVILFFFMHLRNGAIFIYGTPWRNARKDGGRGCWENFLKTDLVVLLLWVLMLTSSIVLEIFIILPAMKGLDLNSTCGLGFLGQVIGIPAQVGECSEKDFLRDKPLALEALLDDGLLLFALTLVLVGCIVDIYFIFYIFSAIGGLCMGQYRQLNSVKRVDVPINLRPGGKDAERFEAKIGHGWRMVWGRMVHSLLSESLIDQRMAEWLRKAAEPPGGEGDPGRVYRRQDKKDLPDDKHKDKLIHLSRFPQIVAERLAFFFQSLERIQEPGDGTQVEETDRLTSPDFEPGTVPSLTQIIPCYQEATDRL
ncbi:CALS7 [Symbiodinium natans]|uniref:CALS7 protein n=1 Tax=Symbiodinium natans TaxID=878477 RepID=A0A812JVS8_9DINO|nr:CALS7 [Symbiodinium natans]